MMQRLQGSGGHSGLVGEQAGASHTRAEVYKLAVNVKQLKVFSRPGQSQGLLYKQPRH